MWELHRNKLNTRLILAILEKNTIGFLILVSRKLTEVFNAKVVKIQEEVSSGY